MHALDDGERSVSAAFHLSYQQLPPDQQRMSALLALHRGPDIDAHGAAALAGVGVQQAERLLERLRDAHLVDLEDPGRYRLPDLVRAFATKHASLPAADRKAAVGRLLDHMLRVAEAADILMSPHRHRPAFGLPAGPRPFVDRTEAKAWLDVEWPNLAALCRTALVYGVYNRCWQLAYSLKEYFYLAKLWDPWIETHTLAIDAARELGDQRAEAITLRGIALMQVDTGAITHAIRHAADSLAVFRHLGMTLDAVMALNVLGRAYFKDGKYTRAAACYREVIALSEENGGRFEAARAEVGLSQIAMAAGREDEAAGHLARAEWLHPTAP